MAGMNAFFAKALEMVAGGISRLSPSMPEGLFSAIKSGAGDAVRAGGLGVSGMKGLFNGFKAMKSAYTKNLEGIWSEAVAANPALSSVKLGANKLPKMTVSEYLFGGFNHEDKIRRLMNPNTPLNELFANAHGRLNANSAVRMGVAGAAALPVVSSMVFGSDSMPTNALTGLRNMGLSSVLGAGVGGMYPAAGAGYLGLSGFNMLRGAGFSPFSTFGR